MLEPKNTILDDVEFQFLPMDPFVVVKLEKRLMPLVLPIVAGIKGFDASAKISEVLDFGLISKALIEAIQGLSDTDFESLLKQILSHVTTVLPGAGAVDCSSIHGKTVFSGNTLLMYKVVVEAMRFNKFLPFAVLGDGAPIKEIASSLVASVSKPASGLRLER